MNSITAANRPIRLLPPALRNQIAAGEVVERPSSVLKELVENSLDAGATDIAVTLEDGGQTLVAVRDNGRGIAQADLELAVTRHATSKVASFSDLLRVSDYGFRGEALASIGSVSDMLLQSAFRPDGPDSPCEPGAFIRVRHGEIADTGPSALPGGNLIEVRDLFANVPARLKFLKSPAAELKRCREHLIRLALARLDVTFTLGVSGDNGKERELLRLPAGHSLEERLLQIWPPQVAESLVTFSGGRSGLAVSGLVSLPQQAQAKSDRMLFYVNRRPVNNRLLLQAVRQAYQGRLTSREYPQALLFLDIDPQEVDVNVHPAKSEVRFRDERTVFGTVLRSIEVALAGHAPGAFAAEGPFGQTVSRENPAASAEQLELPPLHSADAFELPRQSRPDGFWGSLDRPRLVEFSQRPDGAEAEPEPFQENGFSGADAGVTDARTTPQAFTSGLYRGSRPAALHEDGISYAPGGGLPPGAEEGTFMPAPEAGPFLAGREPLPGGGYPVTVGSMICLGQVADTYLIIVQGESLLLLDQHAAHERVLLHALEQQTTSAGSQLLALPAELALHPSEQERLQSLFGQLARLGFALETGGGREQGTVAVSGVPPLLGRTKGLELLRDILADRTDGIEDLLHLMACRAAIKAGQRLTGDEAAGLLRKWAVTPDCRFCPHGRPTVLAFDPAALEKMFKRKIG